MRMYVSSSCALQTLYYLASKLRVLQRSRRHKILICTVAAIQRIIIDRLQ